MKNNPFKLIAMGLITLLVLIIFFDYNNRQKIKEANKFNPLIINDHKTGNYTELKYDSVSGYFGVGEAMNQAKRESVVGYYEDGIYPKKTGKYNTAIGFKNLKMGKHNSAFGFYIPKYYKGKPHAKPITP